MGDYTTATAIAALVVMVDSDNKAGFELAIN